MQEYPLSSLEAQIKANNTPTAWSDEGFEIGRNFVYKGVTEHQDIPADYAAKAKVICRQRVALGGYRLGMVIDSIYKTLNPTSSLQSKAETEAAEEKVNILVADPLMIMLAAGN